MLMLGNKGCVHVYAQIVHVGKISAQPHTLIIHHHCHTNPFPKTNKVFVTKCMTV